ncbi:MAG: Bax inhibitor-1/YccA family protein [Ilumatobacteraceae bacterium]
MANPLLNDKALPEAAKRSGTWAAPDPNRPGYGMPTAPITDGPVSPWNPSGTDQKVMTVGGTASATGVLFVLLLVSAAFGWFAVDPASPNNAGFPGLAMIGVLVGFAAVIASYFKPQWARFLGPVYALAEGYFLGVISHYYDAAYDGIVVQAAGATVAVFGAMLFLYKTNVIRVTDKFRRIVIGATMGVMVFYGISLLINLFGGSVSFLQSSSLFGIGFSFFVAGLAAMNLALDFDFIEKGSKARLPQHMEWFAAMGLLVTLVWLYLEILRLLAKLRDR